MSLESGAITLRRFLIKGRCKPSSDPFWIETLKSHQFTGKKLDLEEENVGWAVLGDELSIDFTLPSTVFGKFIVFSLRRDSLRIPSSLVNLHLKHRVRERMQSEELEAIGKKQQSEIKEDILKELLEKTDPTIQVIQVMIDTARHEVYLGSTSDKVVEIFERLFQKSFDLSFQNADFLNTAHQILGPERFDSVLDEPGIAIGNPIEIHPEYEDQAEGKLGAAFLTWLLFTLQTGDATWTSKHQGEVGLVLHEYLLLEGEAIGSKQMLLKKGVLSSCAELATALNIGKLVSKIRLTAARDGGTAEQNETEMWTFTIDKLHFDFSGVKVPASREGNTAARLLGRFNYTVDLIELLEDLFEHYLDLRYGENWERVLTDMSQWVRSLSNKN